MSGVIVGGIGDAEAAAKVHSGDGEAFGLKLAHQLHNFFKGQAHRCDVSNLAADMYIHPDRFDARQIAATCIHLSGFMPGDAEFVLGAARRDIGVAACINMRVHTERDRRGFTQ